MNTTELEILGNTLLDDFIGVFPLDRLPTIKGSFIINTHTHKLPGEHWIAVKVRMHNIYVFDPMGMYYPSKLVSHLHRSRKHVVYNKSPIQNLNTRTCGQLCIVWLTNHHLLL